MEPCQTQPADVDNLRSHLPPEIDTQLNALQRQARRLDKWSLFIGLIPL
jgi:hypothetical protein